MAVSIVATLVGVIVLAVVVVTIVLVARGPRTRNEGSRGGRRRPVARSMRGWQAQTLRDIRRSGRSHGTRGR